MDPTAIWIIIRRIIVFWIKVFIETIKFIKNIATLTFNVMRFIFAKRYVLS